VLSFAFTDLVESSSVIPPSQQQTISSKLEDDAEVMSDTKLEALLVDEPPDVQAEILHINSEARDRSLQVALLVPVLASAVGVVNGFRMRRLPDISPTASTEGLGLG